MAGIADIVVILGRAGQREGIVPAAGVLDHFDQRQHVLIIVFRVQARHRVGVFHQRARGGHVERVLDSLVELARCEALEIGALPTVHIEDLDVVARFHEIGLGGGRMNADVGNRVGQRIGKFEPGHALDHRAADIDGQRCRRVLRFEIHDPAGGRDDGDAVARRGETLRAFRGRLGAEQMHRLRLRQVQTARLDPHPQAAQRLIAGCEQRVQPLW